MVATIGVGGGNINFTIPVNKEGIFSINNNANGRSANLVLDNAANYASQSTYSLVVTATHSDSGCAVNQVLTITVNDTTAPTLALVGDSSVSIESGSTYTDAGYTASDNDGAPSITTNSTVNTVTAGVYSVTYTATDAAGNETSVTRTVTVVDTTAPVITVTGDTAYC